MGRFEFGKLVVAKLLIGLKQETLSLLFLIALMVRYGHTTHFFIIMTLECKPYQLVFPLLVIQGGIVGSIAGTCHFFQLRGMSNSWKTCSSFQYVGSLVFAVLILVYIALVLISHGV